MKDGNEELAVLRSL